MSNLFSNLTDNGLEEQKDTLGGFSLLESGIYPAKIKVAYAGRSQSGAMNVTVHADIDGREYRETVYITNKNGENFYSTKDGKKNALPGFAVINDLCQICCHKPLNQMDTEDKTMMVYNNELQKEVPTKVPVLMELIGGEAKLGIIKERRFKTVASDKGYVETDEVRENNIINKVFDPYTNQTVYEINHNLTESPLFLDKWKDKNDGVVSDKTKKGHTGPTGNAMPPKRPEQAPRKSLFN